MFPLAPQAGQIFDLPNTSVYNTKKKKKNINSISLSFTLCLVLNLDGEHNEHFTC